jgi:hypothetical protein
MSFIFAGLSAGRAADETHRMLMVASASASCDELWRANHSMPVHARQSSSGSLFIAVFPPHC